MFVFLKGSALIAKNSSRNFNVLFAFIVLYLDRRIYHNLSRFFIFIENQYHNIIILLYLSIHSKSNLLKNSNNINQTLFTYLLNLILSTHPS